MLQGRSFATLGCRGVRTEWAAVTQFYAGAGLASAPGARLLGCGIGARARDASGKGLRMPQGSKKVDVFSGFPFEPRKQARQIQHFEANHLMSVHT